MARRRRVRGPAEPCRTVAAESRSTVKRGRAMKTTDPLRPDKEFNMLSLKDLIEARDHYHVHLMHKENVVATAVGRYRIRSTDPWPTHRSQDGHPKEGAANP